MLQTTALALVLGFWASLYLIDSFLKTRRKFSSSYLDFMNKNGLSISVAQVRWYTAYFNRLFVRFGTSKPNFLKTWFNIGVVFSLVSMVMSVMLLVMIVINTLRQQPVEQQVLTPVMPGVNLPINQTGYYLLTLFICGIVHEFGHAIAAVREQVHVNGFGIFFLALYPGAFVDLCTEHIQVIPPVRQLRIYCAGVWHNIVTVLSAIMLLIILPSLLWPFYSSGHSVMVTSVVENSAVSGPKGLLVGDTILSVDDCKVTNVVDWVSCLGSVMKGHSSGFCMPLDVLAQQDASISVYSTMSGSMECCSNISNTHLCFYYHTDESLTTKYSCLPARSTTDRPVCHLQRDCYNRENPSVCVTPSLDNSTRLVRLIHESKQPLLFLGHPLDLFYSVTVSNYVPKFSFLPIHLPYILETFCKYLISLSGALAILNVIPCYALDGQWILLAFLDLILPLFVRNPEVRRLIYTVLVLFGSALIGANVFIAFWILFVR